MGAPGADASRSDSCREPHRDREQHRRGRRPLEQGAEQLDRGWVGPVDVVEDQHEQPRRREEAPAARGQRGGCGSARAEGRARGPSRSRRASGRRSTSSVRTSGPSSSRRSGSSPRMYSSRASTKTQNRRSCSSSDAEPDGTGDCVRPPVPRAPRGARLADPRLSDELDRGRRPFESSVIAVERFELFGAPHGLSPEPSSPPALDDTSGHAAREIGVRNQGAAPMPGRRGGGGGSIHLFRCLLHLTTPRRTA